MHAHACTHTHARTRIHAAPTRTHPHAHTHTTVCLSVHHDIIIIPFMSRNQCLPSVLLLLEQQHLTFHHHQLHISLLPPCILWLYPLYVSRHTHMHRRTHKHIHTPIYATEPVSIQDSTAVLATTATQQFPSSLHPLTVRSIRE